jgi:hypothetical protein
LKVHQVAHFQGAHRPGRLGFHHGLAASGHHQGGGRFGERFDSTSNRLAAGSGSAEKPEANALPVI